MSSKRTLKEILDSEYVEDSDNEGPEDSNNDPEVNEDALQESINPDFCAECQDMKIEIICNDCEEQFCVTCFEMLHRGGKRRKHEYLKVNQSDSKNPETEDQQEELQLNNNTLAKIADTPTPDIKSTSTGIDDKLLAQLYKHTQYILSLIHI